MSPIAAENALPGTGEWRLPPPSEHAIEGYSSDVSVAPGETIRFHVSTAPAQPYRIVVYRLGWYGGLGGRLEACLPACDAATPGAAQPLPAPDPVTGEVAAGWPVTDALAIPADWVSGYYDAKLVLLDGPQRGTAADILFIVRAPAGSQSALLVQVPVNTWQAYNNWGGKSLYDFNSAGGAANHVSFDRPLSPTQPFLWEIQLVRYLEREGYDVSYQTDVDTDRDPAGLLRHRLVMTAGHGEYWTKQMRDAFDSARDLGTNLAFMGANTAYWQVRYEDGGRTIVSYKFWGSDPVADPSLKTVLFRALTPNRWECGLLGVQHQGGIMTTGASGNDYSVHEATDPWFAGTGLVAGSVLPALVGPEWDSIPEDLPAPCFKVHLRVLFQGVQVRADAVKYLAPSGAHVFSTGSLQFAWGLDDFGLGTPRHTVPSDPRLQSFMRNALASLLRPARPLRLRARLAGNAVLLFAELRPDPRISTVAVYRHGGPMPFLPGDADVTSVCTVTRSQPACVDRSPGPPGRYRYAAVAQDAWGVSAVAQSRAVTIAAVGG